MIRAVIVEDEAHARAKLRRWLEQEADFDLVGEAEDGVAAGRVLTEQRPDVVFLDIRIPETDGLALARQLKAEDAPIVVFVTAHAEHAAAAFDIDAVDYLLKPYDKERFDRCVGRVRETLNSRVTPPRPLVVPARDALHLLEGAAITWLESEDNYVRVHAGGQNYLLRRTLQDLLDRLGREFLRIHRSRAVNLAAIATVRPLLRGDAEIGLRDGRTLRVSRRYRQGLKDWLGSCD